MPPSDLAGGAAFTATSTLLDARERRFERGEVLAQSDLEIAARLSLQASSRTNRLSLSQPRHLRDAMGAEAGLDDGLNPPALHSSRLRLGRTENPHFCSSFSKVAPAVDTGCINLTKGLLCTDFNTSQG